MDFSYSNLVLHMYTSHIMYLYIVNGIFIQIVINTSFFFN